MWPLLVTKSQSAPFVPSEKAIAHYYRRQRVYGEFTMKLLRVSKNSIHMFYPPWKC